MIKAIIFDCFGVLVESKYNKFYQTYLYDKPEVIAAIQKLAHESCTGALTQEDFYEGVAALANMQTSDVHRFMKRSLPNLELFQYIENTLKPNYKIGLLSNVATDRMDELFTQDQQQLFDDVVLSYKFGRAKPDVELYKIAAQRLGLETSECTFVDDAQKYVDGAVSAGMKGVLYSSFEQFKKQMEVLL